MNRKNILTFILIVIALVVGLDLYKKYHVAPPMDFYSLSLTDLEGTPVHLRDIQDKKLFLNFFGTWCESCIREMPALEEAQSLLEADKFLFICISDEPVPVLKDLKDKTGIRLLILHSTKTMKEMKISTLPTSYLLNLKGEMVYKKTGERNWVSDEVLHELKLAAE